MDQVHHRWVWMVMVLVVIMGAVVLGYEYYPIYNRITQISPGVTMTTAASGAVVGGFPKGLIVEPGVMPTQSYSISYANGGAQQPVTIYTSSKGVHDNIIMFRTYFVTNGWQIIQPGRESDQPAFMFATKDGDQANISLKALTDGRTQVSISYLSND